jgi:hypothetical protein
MIADHPQPGKVTRPMEHKSSSIRPLIKPALGRDQVMSAS